jgi:folylpolyglutamate synthase/dihydropteroate synthase
MELGLLGEHQAANAAVVIACVEQLQQGGWRIGSEDVARGLREVIDAGAEYLLLNPVGADVGENREQMERLAAEVIPRLS